MKKIFYLLPLFLLVACSTSRIMPATVFSTWKSTYNSKVEVYYQFNCSMSKSGNQSWIYTTEDFIISYNPKSSPNANYTATKGEYKLIFDSKTDKNYIEMLVQGTGKGRLDSDFKNPNYVGQKIKFEILSIDDNTMKVLCDGKKITLTKTNN